MSNCADPARLSPDERLREAAAILAAGVLRLRQRAALPAENGRKNLAESSPDGLEFPRKRGSVCVLVNGFETRTRSPNMTLNVEKELAALRRMSVADLRSRYADVFGETTNTRHKDWLVKRVIWRMQALAEGDLSERARQRAAELANDADLRCRPPAPPATPEAARTRTGKLPTTETRGLRCRPRSSPASTRARRSR